MEINCEKCKVRYDDLYDTVVTFDYAEPGRGKPGHYHLCLNCRKEMIKWLENKV
jgi:hypothetical protein